MNTTIYKVSEIKEATSNENVLRCAGIAKDVIEEFHFVKDRARQAEWLIANEGVKGATIEERPMGSGGVGTISFLKSVARIQIGYGYSKYNYATVIEVDL